MTKDAILHGLSEAGVLPLFYDNDPILCERILQTLYASGIRYIEFTNRGDQALNNFSALVRAKANMPGLCLGVGTIHHVDQAAAFLDLGADFLISPFFDASVADYTYMHKTLWIPGCMTPTEIHHAVANGCEMVKLFPGDLLGPSFVSAIKPLFKQLTFVVTGGVTPEPDNVRAWLSAGAQVVGMGSKLIQPAQLQTDAAFNLLSDKTKTILSTIQDFKNQPNA
jgi:2-dehydro-3-deoxyphosphogluconate aldolase / (4S)-4-hydroxy-2-oxoglutarate aldolase